MSKILKELRPLIIAAMLFLGQWMLTKLALENKEFVEMYYSRKFYIFFAGIGNRSTNWFPYSFGEIFIGLEIALILLLAVYGGVLLFKKSFLKGAHIFQWIVLILVINIVFVQVSWGLNNYRYDAETLFDLGYENITKEELRDAYKFLVEESNRLEGLVHDKKDDYTVSMIQKNTYKGYEELNKTYKFLNPDPVRVKSLIVSKSFNKSGYTGVYLPFFSEANINKLAPVIGIPFTASHEISHQKGIASEDEANFIGFLAVYNHEDDFYKYSGTLAMLSYIGNALLIADHESFYELVDLLNDEVIRDMDSKREYWEEETVKTNQEIHNKINDQFLKANNQPDGIINYSKVTELFVKAYSKGLFE